MLWLLICIYFANYRSSIDFLATDGPAPPLIQTKLWERTWNPPQMCHLGGVGVQSQPHPDFCAEWWVEFPPCGRNSGLARVGRSVPKADFADRYLGPSMACSSTVGLLSDALSSVGPAKWKIQKGPATKGKRWWTSLSFLPRKLLSNCKLNFWMVVFLLQSMQNLLCCTVPETRIRSWPRVLSM